ncbi:hypothetical protein VNO78_07302 [Psophocarpus tetragonolobus]|uniref:Uncharacterized protein n=1 Tax=Psophocarpus tetragonolobus TaxID=3891 RepID=A0AAN9SVZ5_PSOTE
MEQRCLWKYLQNEKEFEEECEGIGLSIFHSLLELAAGRGQGYIMGGECRNTYEAMAIQDNEGKLISNSGEMEAIWSQVLTKEFLDLSLL